MMTVIKLGGSSLEELPALLSFVKKCEGAVVLVHGGGPQINSMLKRVGLDGKFLQGLRVTDDATLEISEMVLSGSVNKNIVAVASSLGIPAVGLSGVDGSTLLASVYRDGAWGRVGVVEKVQTALLDTLLKSGYVPVLSPIGLGPDGRQLNINADMVAAAVASTLGADRLVFLTNVDGLLDKNGQTVTQVDRTEVEAMCSDGTIADGMLPKIESALAALSGGVKLVEIRHAEYGNGTQLYEGDNPYVKAVC